VAAITRDCAVHTWRNLIHIAREPLRLSDVTVQPVLFTLLFVYVFGAGVALPGGGSYTSYAIAGLLAFNLTTSAIGTAVGLSTDLRSGVIDRFRTLPQWPAVVLVGRSVADLMTAAVCTAIVLLTGLVVGWRPDGTVLQTVGAIGIVLLFAYPLSFVSNALVPTQRMRRCCARSPTGTRSAPWPPPPGSCSTTRTRRPRSAPGRCSTRWRRR
jgi:ABC-2 type transport system permease protein